MVTQQGGDPRVVAELDRLPQAPERVSVTASTGGVVTAIDPLALGWGVVQLGGGRRGTAEPIDAAVGFELEVTVG